MFVISKSEGSTCSNSIHLSLQESEYNDTIKILLECHPTQNLDFGSKRKLD